MPSLPCVEPARLLRGATRPVRRMGPGEYAVAGTRHIWFVNLNSDTPCECPDFFYRGDRVGACCHIYSALLQERDERTVAALAFVLGTLARYAERTADHPRRKAA